MARTTDLANQRFGKLTVIDRAAAVNGRRLWRCRCDCGNETYAPTGHLNAGMRISCGCAMPATKRTHGKSRSPEYRAWESARSRCRNPRNRKFPLYGGRGIRMCAEWEGSFEAFYRDLGPRPSAKHSLDRIDSAGDYAPGNCRWATIVAQNNNRSFNRFIHVNGARLTVAEASRIFGVNHATILSRLNAGKSDWEAVHG